MSEMDSLSQGAKANRQGEALFQDILRVLDQYGWVRVTLATTGAAAVAELPRHAREILLAGGRVFAQEVSLCEGLFGSPHSADFLLYDCRWPEPLALAGRHQHVSGSAREKLPLLADTVEQRYPCPCLLVLEGPFMAGDPRVMRWARERAQQSNGRLRTIFTGVYAFRQWMTAGCPFPVVYDPLLL
jgi:hypothetical protein